MLTKKKVPRKVRTLARDGFSSENGFLSGASNSAFQHTISRATQGPNVPRRRSRFATEMRSVRFGQVPRQMVVIGPRWTTAGLACRGRKTPPDIHTLQGGVRFPEATFLSFNPTHWRSAPGGAAPFGAETR